MSEPVVIKLMTPTEVKEKVDREIAEWEEQRQKDIAAGLCTKCHTNPAQPPHTCPYEADVHNNEEFLCTCCKECTKECSYEI